MDAGRQMIQEDMAKVEARLRADFDYFLKQPKSLHLAFGEPLKEYLGRMHSKSNFVTVEKEKTDSRTEATKSSIGFRGTELYYLTDTSYRTKHYRAETHQWLNLMCPELITTLTRDNKRELLEDYWNFKRELLNAPHIGDEEIIVLDGCSVPVYKVVYHFAKNPFTDGETGPLIIESIELQPAGKQKITHLSKVHDIIVKDPASVYRYGNTRNSTEPHGVLFTAFQSHAKSLRKREDFLDHKTTRTVTSVRLCADKVMTPLQEAFEATTPSELNDRELELDVNANNYNNTQHAPNAPVTCMVADLLENEQVYQYIKDAVTVWQDAYRKLNDLKEKWSHMLLATGNF